MGKGEGSAHHIIPIQLLKDNEVVQDAVSAGFDFNGAINGVKAVKNHGPHLDYTQKIRTLLDDFIELHPNYTPEDAKNFLESVAKKYKEDIIKKKEEK